MVRDWPEFWPAAEAPSSLYDGQFADGWADQSYLAVRKYDTGISAMHTQGSALCNVVQEKGAIVLAATYAGAFENRIALSLWVYGE